MNQCEKITFDLQQLHKQNYSYQFSTSLYLVPELSDVRVSVRNSSTEYSVELLRINSYENLFSKLHNNIAFK